MWPGGFCVVAIFKRRTIQVEPAPSCKFLPLSVSIGPAPEVRRDVTNKREDKPDQDSRRCKQCLISEGLCTEKADEATTRQIVRSGFCNELGGGSSAFEKNCRANVKKDCQGDAAGILRMV